MRFYAPIPRSVGGEDHYDLIRRLFRPSAPIGTQRIDLVTTTRLRVSIIDSGMTPELVESEGDSVIHVLWQMDETNASISIGGDRSSIAPGDTAAIPIGDEWDLSPNQLVIQIVRRSHDLAVPVAPHHGTEAYTGHNRCTSYDLPSSLAIQRWKLTEPLAIPASPDHDLILIGLYNDLALQHRSEIELMPQGEVRVIRTDNDSVTLVPNGLTYVLSIPADQDTPLGRHVP